MSMRFLIRHGWSGRTLDLLPGAFNEPVTWPWSAGSVEDHSRAAVLAVRKPWATFEELTRAAPRS